MFSTAAITALSESGARGNRQWTPGQQYSGFVQEVDEDGSIEVIVNNRAFRATAHQGARPGDFLSLKLLGTEPEPHFAVIDVLRRNGRQESPVKVHSSWQEAVNILRRIEPGLGSLVTLWQRYPQELARFSSQFPGLMAALQSRVLDEAELTRPGRLKAHALSSGLFFDQDPEETDDPELPDLKPLLFRMLALLPRHRQLVLQDGKAVFADPHNTAAQTLQDKTIALYSSEQSSEPGGSQLWQLLGLNVEHALQSLISNQLASARGSDANLSMWLINLVLGYGNRMIPLELDIQRRGQATGEQWQVAFNLELPRAGRIHAELTVKKPAAKLVLHCDNPELTPLLNNGRTALRRLLGRVDLLLEEFECGHMEAKA